MRPPSTIEDNTTLTLTQKIHITQLRSKAIQFFYDKVELIEKLTSMDLLDHVLNSILKHDNPKSLVLAVACLNKTNALTKENFDFLNSLGTSQIPFTYHVFFDLARQQLLTEHNVHAIADHSKQFEVIHEAVRIFSQTDYFKENQTLFDALIRCCNDNSLKDKIKEINEKGAVHAVLYPTLSNEENTAELNKAEQQDAETLGCLLTQLDNEKQVTTASSAGLFKFSVPVAPLSLQSQNQLNI